jgi:hypothetical protein
MGLAVVWEIVGMLDSVVISRQDRANYPENP